MRELGFDSSFRHRRPWAFPLLRWAGSKRKLLPWLMQCIPQQFKRYIEPFAGSACLFFALRPARAILGDVNFELLHAYDIIRSHPRLVFRAASALKNTKCQYDRLRRIPPESLNPIDRAARFVYLNRYCFNGVYRTNQKNEFNVPRGSRTGRMPGEPVFYRCSVALRSTELRAVDFADCLTDLTVGDFVYLDPPYTTTSRPTHGEYGYDCFGRKDLYRLVDRLAHIHRAGAFFLLSYAADQELENLQHSWFYRRLSVRRHVAGFAEHRTNVGEILVSNYAPNNS